MLLTQLKVTTGLLHDADARLSNTSNMLKATMLQLDITSEALVQTRYGLKTAFVLFGAFNVFVMQARDS